MLQKETVINTSAKYYIFADMKPIIEKLSDGKYDSLQIKGIAIHLYKEEQVNLQITTNKVMLIKMETWKEDIGEKVDI